MTCSTQPWMSVEQAATFLGLPTITLRRALERGARKLSDGGTVAQIDGVHARKFGRLWRVRLDVHWMAPPSSASSA